MTETRSEKCILQQTCCCTNIQVPLHEPRCGRAQYTPRLMYSPLLLDSKPAQHLIVQNMRLNQPQENDAIKGCCKHKMCEAAARVTWHTMYFTTNFILYK